MAIKRSIRLLILAILASNVVQSTNAINTNIAVRVKSKDAKFIGSSMGGVLVTITDFDTKEVIAKGYTAGTTGDTKAIMQTPIHRGKSISDDKSAKFIANLDINRPMLVEISAFGPMAQRQSASKVSVTHWIIPGKHIDAGDAILLELPGFIVDILSPPAHIKYPGTPQVISMKANVTMMCGCPIKPNGIWDANKFDIAAIMYKDGIELQTIKMSYAGETSQFSVNYTALETGIYEIVVYAFDKSNGNTGVDRTTFVIK